MFKFRWLLPLFALALAPRMAWGCACGCGVFGVGSTFLLPEQDTTCMVYFEYDYLDQNQNWSGIMQSPAAANNDKDIRTQFFNMGLMYTINEDWTVMANVPYWDRSFTTEVAPGDIETFGHGALGDVKLMGIYTGFASDRSTGAVFGIKLPTGDHNYENFDPDTEIGTGSTDIILGAYHVGKFEDSDQWRWFAEANWECPIATTQGYRPGDEIDAAAGVFYNTKQIGPFKNVSPVLQLIFSDRAADEGINADPLNTGYYRCIVSPGLEVDFEHIKMYADTEFPFLQYINGNQLTAPVAAKMIFAYAY